MSRWVTHFCKSVIREYESSCNCQSHGPGERVRVRMSDSRVQSTLNPKP